MSMSGYTKLFNSILASTIWRAPDKARILWITMLAMADKHGYVEGSVPGLADFARMAVGDTRKALELLSAPDPDSRSREFDGRRIEPVDGGWQILNHAKYRAKMNADDRREYNRLKKSESRQKLSTNVKDVNDTSALSAHSRSRVQKQSTEAEAVAADSGPPSATAIREPGLILSPARYAQRLRFCAFVGSKIEIPNDLHAELRAKHGGPDPETALQNWYVTLNDRAETEAWQIPTGKAIFAWVKDHYAVAFPPTPAPVAVVTRDRLSGQAQDQQQKTQEVIRLMRDEGLSREAAMSRVFR